MEEQLRLFPHQVEAVKFIKQRNYCCLVADDMGLGKTISAIAAVNESHFTAPIVVCPASVESSWRDETNKWSQKPWQIAKYTHFSRRPKGYPKGDIVVLDESHYIKSMESQRTRKILTWLKQLDCPVILLSGTPVTRTIEDLYPQLVAIKVLKPGSLTWYRQRYMAGKDFYGNWHGENRETIHELQHAYNKIRIRRTKDQELDLPPKIISHRYVAIPSTLSRELDGVTISEDLEETEHISQLRRLVGLAKVEPALRYIKMIREGKPENSGYPMVVFAHHREVVSELQQKLNCPVISGSTPPGRRGELVREFQAGSHDYLVCNIHAAGEGITLHKSCHSVMVELDWSPAKLKQAEDRIYRIGQPRRCSIDYILADHEFERSIIGILKRKQRLIDEMEQSNG